MQQQPSLFESQKKEGPVTCLGRTFANEEARRSYFTEELRKQLPELRKMEGFPIGEDEDILALSDPPYYTACPNPFIPEIMKEWEAEKKSLYGEEEEYHREPFAADVKEGKNDPIYNAHSYHTKVPHKAIMRYLLHYTNPGDIVFDGFAGTGMTGVAAQLCGDRTVVESLGYQVQEDGTILDEEGKPFSRLGARKAVLNDLSPAATFIAYNYNTPVDAEAFRQEAERILAEVEQECGWMYETRHVIDDVPQMDTEGKPVMGRINYTVWSDVFVCPECSEELVFWEVAVDQEQGKVNDSFSCPHCQAQLTKKRCERAWVSRYDLELGETVKQAKQVPVLINYTYQKKRFEKKPDSFDLSLIRKIEESEISYWVPTNRMAEGEESRRNDRVGITHVHHFYTKRNLFVLSSIWEKSRKLKILRFTITSILVKTASLLHNIGFKKGKINLAGALPNTLYIPSNLAERNIIELIRGKIKDIKKAELQRIQKGSSISTLSCSDYGKKHFYKNKFDYIFIDPPFGYNLMYSELNYIWESWLQVFTDKQPEAIESKAQEKNLNDYRVLMTSSFKTIYKLLKPGRWMTVEFSNTKANVWNTIQTAIQEAGFIVVNVSALNKGQGSYNAQTNPTSVEQDLVISAYKPSKEFISKMNEKSSTDETVWIFIKQFLTQVPVFNGYKGHARTIVERTPRVLFDKMVAYHVQNGYPVPLSSAEFQAQITEHFIPRDGMVFLDTQVAEYNKKRILVKEFTQLNLFVSDETSAIEWLRQQLMKKPQTYQDLHPNFMKEIQHIAKHEALPELQDLLSQNFLCYVGDGPIPDQIQSYLNRNYPDLRPLAKEDLRRVEKARNRWYVPDPNKQADLEKLREKALLREFNGYVEELGKSRKKLKVFRTEAVRAGFKKAWSEKDYETIVQVGERLPEKVINEDDKLLMYFNNAQIRLGL